MAGGGLGSSSRAIKRSDSLRAQHRHGQPSATILASPARQRGGWWHYSPACVRGTCGKAKKSKRFIFESYENALGRFPCRGPLCPLSEGPCGARSCPPSALDLLNFGRSTELSHSRTFVSWLFVARCVELLQRQCESIICMQADHSKPGLSTVTASPAAIGQSLLLRVAVDGRLFADCSPGRAADLLILLARRRRMGRCRKGSFY